MSFSTILGRNKIFKRAECFSLYIHNFYNKTKFDAHLSQIDLDLKLNIKFSLMKFL